LLLVLEEMSRVFVDHDSQTEAESQDVFDFVKVLRQKGVVATVDIHRERSPPNNWTVWREQQASDADFLLLIMSQSLTIRLTQCGSQSPETETLRSIVFGCPRNKMIPVFLNRDIDDNLVPLSFWGCQSYAIHVAHSDSGPFITEDDSFIALYARLTGQCEVSPVGSVVIYPKEQVLEANRRLDLARTRRLAQVGIDQTDTGPVKCDLERDAGPSVAAIPNLSLGLSMVKSLQGSMTSREAVSGQCTRDLIGRKEEITSMKEKLSFQSSVDVVGLFGSTGSGKSETAKLVAFQLKVADPTMQLTEIDMHNCPSKDKWAAHFLDNIFMAPSTKPNAIAELHRQIRTSGKMHLLLVDNCESSSGKHSDFVDFIASVVSEGKGRVKCLLVSQSRFSIKQKGISMWVQPWKSLESSDATKLFFKIAGGSDCLEDEASKICSLCGNIPLTVKGAASIVGSGRMSGRNLLKELETNNIVRVLDCADSDLSLTLMLKASFERWSNAERESFVSLCVFPGSFSIQFAAAVLHTNCLKNIRDIMWCLANVQRLEEDMYELHGVYRGFGRYVAEEMAADTFGPILEAARKSYLRACCHLIKDLSENFEQDVFEVKKKFLQEYHNIKKFMAEAANIPEGLEESYCSAALYSPYLMDTFVSPDEQVDFYQHCIKAASRAHRVWDECQLRYWLAQNLINEGHITTAKPLVSSADQLFDDLALQNHDELQSLHGLRHYTTSLLLNRGDRHKQVAAADSFQLAVESFVDLTEMKLQQSNLIPVFICGSLGIRSLTECSSSESRVKGHNDRAIQFANASLTLCNQLRKSEYHPDRLMCLNSLAVAHMTGRNFKEAKQTFESATGIQEKLTGKHRDLAILLANTAQCLAELCQYQGAKEKISESFAMLSELYGNQHKETLRSQYELAVICEKCSDHDLALEHYRGVASAVDKLNETDRGALDFDPEIVKRQIQKLQKRDPLNYAFLFQQR
jgi:tetratricopeptide (TPR) repeat protein